ncbi:MAG: phospholipase D-like domain-containing protein [Oscillospiraceae bacterium]|nr:phospholipase D-like domain-containing protein [Oscillospiraceae bacterium]
MNNKIITYLENIGFAPTRDKCLYLPTGQEFFGRLLYELGCAKSYILLEFFNIEKGVLLSDVINILRYKISEGVQVRLVYDPVGCLATLPRRIIREMKEAGIEVRTFRPAFRGYKLPPLNHRKLVVIDGQVAFCGGVNLADRYANVVEKFGYWKDSGVQLTKQLTVDNGQLTIPIFDSPHERIGEHTFINFVSSTQSYLYITTPYIVCTSGIVSVLAAAAGSGVDVRIITPFIADKRVVKLATESYYEELLRSKIRIFEYLPGFIHSKSMVSDDCRAFVGSMNLDFRSLYRNYECGVCIFDSEVVSDIKRDILETLELCREITLESLQEVSAFKRGLKRTARLFAKLF